MIINVSVPASLLIYFPISCVCGVTSSHLCRTHTFHYLTHANPPECLVLCGWADISLWARSAICCNCTTVKKNGLKGVKVFSSAPWFTGRSHTHTHTLTRRRAGVTYEWAETSEVSTFLKAVIELCQGDAAATQLWSLVSSAKLTISHKLLSTWGGGEFFFPPLCTLAHHQFWVMLTS